MFLNQSQARSDINITDINYSGSIPEAGDRMDIWAKLALGKGQSIRRPYNLSSSWNITENERVHDQEFPHMTDVNWYYPLTLGLMDTQYCQLHVILIKAD